MGLRRRISVSRAHALCLSFILIPSLHPYFFCLFYHYWFVVEISTATLRLRLQLPTDAAATTFAGRIRVVDNPEGAPDELRGIVNDAAVQQGKRDGVGHHRGVRYGRVFQHTSARSSLVWNVRTGWRTH
jgi:hypothetical protein